MAFELSIRDYCTLVNDLRSMKPGKTRDFQPDKSLPPIRVYCVGDVYQPRDVLFQINHVRYKRDNADPWTDVERTACGIFYLQGLKE